MAVPTPITREQLSAVLGAPAPGTVVHTREPLTANIGLTNPWLTELRGTTIVDPE
jgi:hypothetical protein